MSVALTYAARSHLGLGTKSRNEDSAYAGPELLVLCDGMGGHAAGDVASSLVVGELVHLDGESHGADDMLDILETAVMNANDRLAEVGHESVETGGMGTTCIAMLRSGSKLAVANVGDSRAYLRRGSRITQITRDHSFVQQLLDEGRISPEEALHHPQRSLVTRVLTGRAEDHPDLSMRELRPGDRIMICSDGLSDYVAESTISEILCGEGKAGDIADQLVAIGLRASTRDNITVVVVDVVEAGKGTTQPQVVGAVSELGTAPLAVGQTPAEKAAALTRHTQDEPEAPTLAEEDAPNSFFTWLRRGLVGLAIAAVVAAGAYGSYVWTQQQYFVGVQDGYVTVFNGISQDLGPIKLSKADEMTDIAVGDLPNYYQSQVEGTLSADDRQDAQLRVAELRALIPVDCTPLPVYPNDQDDVFLPLPQSVAADQIPESYTFPEGCAP